MVERPASSKNLELLRQFAKAGPAIETALAPVVAAVEAGDLDSAQVRLAGASFGDTVTARRVQLAFQIALSAIAGLRVADVETTIDFTSSFGRAPSLENVCVTNADLQGIAKAMLDHGRGVVARRWPCPSCGGSGKRVGAAPLLGRGQPYGRMYFDLDRLLAPWLGTITASRLEWDLLVAHVMLQTNMRAPVACCEACNLYYLDWPYDPERINAFYAGRETADLTVDGTPISGRGHAPDFVYSKLALPLYVDGVVGGLAGKRVFDLGCAEGLMMEGCRRLGAEVAGSDVDRGKTAYARRLFGLSEVDDRSDAIHRVTPGSVDVLISYHTLEHLVRVGPWLEAMVATLRPGGHLVLSVPQVTLKPNGEAVEMGGDHWIGFDATTLRRHVEAYRLSVIDLRADDGLAPPTDADPVLGLPRWSGRRIDATIVAKRP
jgi:2-polyprenyl-3-methyl-5-hydroxy-6-metoxy-1,4-benzoquinol methylase